MSSIVFEDAGDAWRIKHHNTLLRKDHGYTEVDFLACLMEAEPFADPWQEFWDRVDDWFKHHYPDRYADYVEYEAPPNGKPKVWTGVWEFKYALYMWFSEIGRL